MQLLLYSITLPHYIISIWIDQHIESKFGTCMFEDKNQWMLQETTFYWCDFNPQVFCSAVIFVRRYYCLAGIFFAGILISQEGVSQIILWQGFFCWDFCRRNFSRRYSARQSFAGMSAILGRNAGYPELPDWILKNYFVNFACFVDILVKKLASHWKCGTQIIVENTATLPQNSLNLACILTHGICLKSAKEYNLRKVYVL